MKKLYVTAILIICSVLFTACGSSKESISLEDVVLTFEKELGVEIDREEKPFYTMVGATDGVIFYIDDQKVALYEYKSEKQMNEKMKEHGFDDFEKIGTVTMESSSDKAKEIFNSID